MSIQDREIIRRVCEAAYTLNIGGEEKAAKAHTLIYDKVAAMRLADIFTPEILCSISQGTPLNISDEDVKTMLSIIHAATAEGLAELSNAKTPEERARAMLLADPFSVVRVLGLCTGGLWNDITYYGL